MISFFRNYWKIEVLYLLLRTGERHISETGATQVYSHVVSLEDH